MANSPKLAFSEGSGVSREMRGVKLSLLEKGLAKKTKLTKQTEIPTSFQLMALWIMQSVNNAKAISVIFCSRETLIPKVE